MSYIIDTPIHISKVKTVPIPGQKPGTSGLRKKVTVFQQGYYTHNFIQAYFNALRKDALSPKNTLLVGGDGRYFSTEAIGIAAQLACANGVNELHIAKDSIMSTPACSAYIRHLNEVQGNCLGGILLTASHNPGGPTEDFGIKFNSRNGGPALEELTNLVHSQSMKLQVFNSANFDFLKTIKINELGQYWFTNVHRPGKHLFIIKIIQNVEHYVSLMKELFDFNAISQLLHRGDFTMVFDGMCGAAGPYAKVIFERELKSKARLMNCEPKPDFNGGHPDPNLQCAKELVKMMGIVDNNSSYDFGAACDGDADRNMILGKNFFVTPSDSLAVLASYSQHFLHTKLNGIARSMPTSGAVDRVAQQLGIPLFETPTGWKFFGNLMEEDMIGLCGEESFGTGSPHIREKDGLWTILAWLQVLARSNANTKIGELLGVETIVKNFRKRFGRNYYCRYDFENCDAEKGKAVWEHILGQKDKYSEVGINGSIFEYNDPVDGSKALNQGIIFKYADGSRVIFRQSGTGSVGMTIRIYFQKYQATNVTENQFIMLKEIIDFGLELSQIREITGKNGPTVIT